MQRVVVVGNTGSGKTTLARAVAAAIDAPMLELDSLKHQAGWVPLPLAEFRERATAFIAGDRWVVDGNYADLRDAVWPRADTVVWLDLPRRVVMWRVTTRTLGRWVRRTELWNGNRERVRDWLSWDPERSVLRWAWLQHDAYRQMYTAAEHDVTWAHLRFVRLRSSAEVVSFVAALRSVPASA